MRGSDLENLECIFKKDKNILTQMKMSLDAGYVKDQGIRYLRFVC